MPRPRSVFALVLLGLSAAPTLAQDAIEDRISLLLAEMSVEEKAGQMTQLALGAVSSRQATAQEPDAHELDPDKLREAIVRKHIGSIIHVNQVGFPAAYWQKLIGEIQDIALQETKHKIPLLYGIDSVYGANSVRNGTRFPHNLGLAATWNPELIERVHAVAATETRAAGLPWNFAPCLDLGRQPLWSRFGETFGEDVHLTRTLGTAAVSGLQGIDLAVPTKVAATGRHFLAYGVPVSGRNDTPALLPERYLREYHLPPFEAAIRNAGLRGIMVNSGEINGIPVQANHSILSKLLRGQLEFAGVVMTDWEDVKKLHELHRVAPTLKDAVERVVKAGIDLCIAPSDFQFTDHLVELVREGRVPEEMLDDSCRRILRLKFDLGLFDDPKPAENLLSAIGTEEARALSREAARQSLVLLKNDGVLPLAPGSKIVMTGPGCVSLSALHGAWSSIRQGAKQVAHPPGFHKVITAFEEAHGKDNVRYVPHAYPERFNFEQVVRAAQSADVIVCVLAEEPSGETLGNIDDLAFDLAQRRILREVSFGKPIVLVLLASRPRLISDVHGLANAILFAGRPGPYGGEALYEVLTGEMNPSAKLPFTYPRHPHHILTYRDLQVTPKEPGPDDVLTVTVTLGNTGRVGGTEVVQVYIRDLFASITPPVKRLRAFRRITLEPGKAETVVFEIPVRDLSFIGRQNTPVLEAGEFEVLVGSERTRFELVEPSLVPK